jgi:hypothetical protein
MAPVKLAKMVVECTATQEWLAAERAGAWGSRAVLCGQGAEVANREVRRALLVRLELPFDGKGPVAAVNAADKGCY